MSEMSGRQWDYAAGRSVAMEGVGVRMEYKGQVKQRSKDKRIAYLFGTVLLVFMEIITKQYFYVPLTALLFAALIMQKSHVISEKGIDIRYEIFGYRINNRWKWSEIYAMQPDYQKAAPYVQLLIEKNTSMIRPFVYTKEEYREILKLAERMNPKIIIDHYEEEDIEQVKANRAKAQEQAQARYREEQAKKRKKRKKQK